MKNKLKKALAVLCAVCMLFSYAATPAGAVFTFDEETKVATIDTVDTPCLKIRIQKLGGGDTGAFKLDADGKTYSGLVLRVDNPTNVNIQIKDLRSTAEGVSFNVNSSTNTFKTKTVSAGGFATVSLSGTASANSLGRFTVDYEELGNKDSAKVFSQTAYVVFYTDTYQNKEPLADWAPYTDFIAPGSGYSTLKYNILNDGNVDANRFAYVSVYPKAYFTNPETTLSAIKPEIHFYVKYLSRSESGKDRSVGVYANNKAFDDAGVSDVSCSYTSDNYDFIILNSTNNVNKGGNEGWKTYKYTNETRTFAKGTNTTIPFRVNGDLGNTGGEGKFNDGGSNGDTKNINYNVPYTIGATNGNAKSSVWRGTPFTKGETLQPEIGGSTPTISIQVYDHKELNEAIMRANTVIQRKDYKATGFATDAQWLVLQNALEKAKTAFTTDYFSADGFNPNRGINNIGEYQAYSDNCARAINTAIDSILASNPAERNIYNRALKEVTSKVAYPQNIAIWYDGADITKLLTYLSQDISSYRANQQAQLDLLASNISDEINRIASSLKLKIADYSAYNALVSSADAFIASSDFAAKYTVENQTAYRNALDTLKSLRKDYTIDNQKNVTQAIDTFNSKVSTLPKRKYTVFFKDLNSYILKTQQVAFGESATLPDPEKGEITVPEIAGKQFVGWNGDYTNIKRDTDIITKYDVIKYTVTFTDKDGNPIGTPKSVAHGASVTAPDVPARDDGYLFTGWNRSLDNITGNLVIQALYSFDGFDVTFIRGDNGEPIQTVPTRRGYAATAPTPPEKEGYSFKNWDTSFTNVTQAITVRAIYEPNKYTITLNPNGGTSDGTYADTIQADYDSNVNLPATGFSKVGMRFLGWSENPNAASGMHTIKMAFNKTLYAIYATNAYTVRFVDWDGTPIDDQSVTHGEKATAPTYLRDRVGYTFSGWNVDFSSVTSDLTVKAEYTKKEYEVKFLDYNGDHLKTTKTKYMETAEKPAADPQRTGYTFNGWDVDFSSITGSLTVKATYTKNKYKVTYDSNGGIGVKHEATIDFDSVVDLRNDISSGFVSKTGYKFLGWNTDSNAKAGLTEGYKLPAENITLYAVWELSKFNITFFDNMAAAIVADYGSTVNLPGRDVIQKENCVFEGWSTNPVADDGVFAYKMSDLDVELYPIFRKLETVADISIISSQLDNPALKNYFSDPASEYFSPFEISNLVYSAPMQASKDEIITYTFELNIAPIYKKKNIKVVQKSANGAFEGECKLDSDTGLWQGIVKSDNSVITVDNLCVNYGDVVGGDEEITMADAMAIFKNVIGYEEFTPTQKVLANVSKKESGDTTLVDALIIFLYLSGRISEI